MSNASESGTKRGRGRPAGKRSNPDYCQVGPHIRRQTYEAVRERLGRHGDLGELIEELLSNWLNGSNSDSEFYANLRREITRRRKEADFRRKNAYRRWNPENINTLELCQLVEWIESELDKHSKNSA